MKMLIVSLGNDKPYALVAARITDCSLLNEGIDFGKGDKPWYWTNHGLVYGIDGLQTVTESEMWHKGIGRLFIPVHSIQLTQKVEIESMGH